MELYGKVVHYLEELLYTAPRSSFQFANDASGKLSSKFLQIDQGFLVATERKLDNAHFPACRSDAKEQTHHLLANWI